MKNIKRFFVGTYGTRTVSGPHGLLTVNIPAWIRMVHDTWDFFSAYSPSTVRVCVRDSLVGCHRLFEALRCRNFKILSNAFWFYGAVTGYGISFVPHNLFIHHARNKRSARVFR